MLITLAWLAVGLDAGDRFRAEYPREVAALQREFADVRGVATLRRVAGQKLGQAASVRFASGPDRAKFEFVSRSQRGSAQFDASGSVICRNDELCFRLARTKKDGPYSLISIGDDPHSRAQFHTTFGKYMDAPWTIASRGILDMMGTDRFRIIGSRGLNEAGRDLIEVVFESGHSSQKADLVRVAFDPAFHWAIVRAELRAGSFGDRLLERSKLDYFVGPSGSRYIHDVRLVDIAGKETLCEFGSVEFTETPAAEFTLAHYGLNDPMRKPRTDSSIAIRIGVFALAVGLLALGRWLSRRARRSAA